VSVAAAIDRLVSIAETSMLVTRLRNAGCKPANEEAAAVATELREALAPLARMHRLNGEKRGSAVLDWVLQLDSHKVLDQIGHDVQQILPEYQLGRCRADRVLIHASGQMTIVEVKDCLPPQEIAKGIGQVLYYKALAEKTTSAGPIVPALAALVEGDEDIARACALAGVLFLPLGDLRFMKTLSKLADLALNPYSFL
jgi:hypothetical protein